MSKRKLYEDQVREKLRELEAEVDKLKAKIENTEADLLPEHRSKMEALHSLQEETKAKFNELLEAGDEVSPVLRIEEYGLAAYPLIVEVVALTGTELDFWVRHRKSRPDGGVNQTSTP